MDERPASGAAAALALLRRSATTRAVKRWQFQHELAATTGPELVAMASRWPELNPTASLARIRGRASSQHRARPARKCLFHDKPRLVI